MKVLLNNKGGASLIVDIPKTAQLYPHFKLKELANNKGDTNTYQYILTPETDEFLCMIEEFRIWWNKPMTCNSCYRQPAYNKSIGGASNSLHLQARAFDWAVNLNYSQRVSVCNQWRSICKRHNKIGGINFYSWGCHFDDHEDFYGYNNFVIRNGNAVVYNVPRP